jgi:branched-subunit amino acid aminotransferase/4-amino-4-deoxychorismate lyase
MIWVDGRVLPDDALRVSVLDRTFEHGLGLFETLRTWHGVAPLLDRHLARMDDSALALELPFGSVRRPDDSAVSELLEAERLGGDAMLRVTLSGGFSKHEGATLWMRALPLPPPPRKGGALVEAGRWSVLSVDPLARHKTLNYWMRRWASESSRALGFDEILAMSLKGVIWEGSRTNVFLFRHGSLVTPSLDGPIVPGIMRGLVIEHARGIGLDVWEEKEMTETWLETASEVFLTNSVRGIIPVARVEDHAWPAPGPWTQKLSILVNDWLRSGGDPT